MAGDSSGLPDQALAEGPGTPGSTTPRSFSSRSSVDREAQLTLLRPVSPQTPPSSITSTPAPKAKTDLQQKSGPKLRAPRRSRALQHAILKTKPFEPLKPAPEPDLAVIESALRQATYRYLPSSPHLHTMDISAASATPESCLAKLCSREMERHFQSEAERLEEEATKLWEMTQVSTRQRIEKMISLDTALRTTQKELKSSIKEIHALSLKFEKSQDTVKTLRDENKKLRQLYNAVTTGNKFQLVVHPDPRALVQGQALPGSQLPLSPSAQYPAPQPVQTQVFGFDHFQGTQSQCSAQTAPILNLAATQSILPVGIRHGGHRELRLANLEVVPATQISAKLLHAHNNNQCHYSTGVIDHNQFYQSSSDGRNPGYYPYVQSSQNGDRLCGSGPLPGYDPTHSFDADSSPETLVQPQSHQHHPEMTERSQSTPKPYARQAFVDLATIASDDSPASFPPIIVSLGQPAPQNPDQRTSTPGDTRDSIFSFEQTSPSSSNSNSVSTATLENTVDLTGEEQDNVQSGITTPDSSVVPSLSGQEEPHRKKRSYSWLEVKASDGLKVATGQLPNPMKKFKADQAAAQVAKENNNTATDENPANSAGLTAFGEIADFQTSGETPSKKNARPKKIAKPRKKTQPKKANQPREATSMSGDKRQREKTLPTTTGSQDETPEEQEEDFWRIWNASEENIQSAVNNTPTAASEEPEEPIGDAEALISNQVAGEESGTQSSVLDDMTDEGLGSFLSLEWPEAVTSGDLEAIHEYGQDSVAINDNPTGNTLGQNSGATGNLSGEINGTTDDMFRDMDSLFGTTNSLFGDTDSLFGDVDDLLWTDL